MKIIFKNNSNSKNLLIYNKIKYKNKSKNSMLLNVPKIIYNKKFLQNNRIISKTYKNLKLRKARKNELKYI